MFILGGTDDIQVLLDDSQVSMEQKRKEEKGKEGGKGRTEKESSEYGSFLKMFFCQHNRHHLCACKHFSHSLTGKYLHHSRLSARGTHQVQGGRAQPPL